MQNVKVLLLEKDSIVSTEISEKVKKLGYELISIVDSGEKAIETAEKESPDIVLIDIQHEGEKEGTVTAGIIRTQFKIPVLFLVTNEDEEKLDRTNQAMPFGLLLKPLQEKDLKLRVEMALYVAKVDKKRRIAEQALLDSDENFRFFLDKSTVITIVVRDLKVIYANKMALEKSEYSKEEILKLTIQDLTAPSEVELALSRWERRDGNTNPKRTFDMALMTKSKKIIWARVFHIKLSWQGEPAYMHFVTDITAAMEVEQALIESEIKFRSVVENMTEGVIISKDFIPSYVNKSVCELSGYSERELLGRRMDRIFTVNSIRNMLNIIDQIKPGVPVKDEVEVVTKSGSQIDVLLSSIPIMRNGQYEKTVSILTDITHLKYQKRILEQEVNERTRELTDVKEKAEQLSRLKTEFLANISHELRTPMHAILSYSSFGYEKFDQKDSETLAKYFKNIHLSGNRLLNLLNDLLDLSRLQTDKMKYVKEVWNLSTVFDQLIAEYEILGVDKNISWKIQETGNIRMLFDFNKICQVVANLFSNALKYAEKNTVIDVSIEDTLSKLIVTIENEGVPIPADELESIFDPFVQSSETKTGAGGTGLGLPICKKIIEDHRGEIWAEYNPNGATIKFFLLKEG